jgi:hypothetical protein
MIVAIALLSCLAPRADAELQKFEVAIATDGVATRTTSDSLETICYTLRFDVPDDVRTRKLVSAVLEFYADVSATAVNEWVNETPVIELYALNASVSENVSVGTFRRPSAAVRAVRIGQGRRITLDLTEIVRDWIKDPRSNHGVALGSFRGGRECVLSLRDGILGSEQFAKITFVCDKSIVTNQ